MAKLPGASDEPEVKPEDEDKDEDGKGTITVDLEAKPPKGDTEGKDATPEAQAEKDKAAKEAAAREQATEAARQDERLRAAERQINAQRRVTERLQTERDRYAEQVRKTQAAVDVSQAPAKEDDLDALVEKDWKEAVRRVSREEFTRGYNQAQQEEAQHQAQQQSREIQEASKQRTVARYPALGSDDAEGAEVRDLYQEVVNADGSLLQNEHGPEIAMYRMEQLAQERGLKLAPTVEKATPPARGREGSGSLPPSRGTPRTGNKFVMTRDQKEYCDLHGISYEDYARMARTTEETGGVEV